MDARTTESTNPSDAEHGDLVVAAISGDQRFISEPSNISDLAVGSAIDGRLAGRATQESLSLSARLVFPASVERLAESQEQSASSACKGGDALRLLFPCAHGPVPRHAHAVTGGNSVGHGGR